MNKYDITQNNLNDGTGVLNFNLYKYFKSTINILCRYIYGGNLINAVKHREIYYANLNPAVGSEQGGIEPVVIIQNNKGNKYSHTTIVAPITSRKK